MSAAALLLVAMMQVPDSAGARVTVTLEPDIELPAIEVPPPEVDLHVTVEHQWPDSLDIDSVVDRAVADAFARCGCVESAAATPWYGRLDTWALVATLAWGVYEFRKKSFGSKVVVEGDEGDEGDVTKVVIIVEPPPDADPPHGPPDGRPPGR